MTTEPSNHTYTYDPSLLTAGASLGTPAAFAYLDPRTNPRGIWSAADNRFVLGPWDVRLSAGDTPLAPERTTFGHAFQETAYALPGLSAAVSFFLPFLAEAAETRDVSPMQAAVMTVQAVNGGTTARELVIEHSLTFPARPSGIFMKQPPEHETRREIRWDKRDGRLVAFAADTPEEARLFGADIPWSDVSGDAETARVRCVVRLEAGERKTASFVLAWSARGEAEASRIYEGIFPVDAAFQQTARTLEGLLGRSEIVTPDPLINRGIEWSKVNTLRVQHVYRTGPGFTNDPPQDIVVVRDLAWYVFGSDYLTPGFSRALLETALRVAVHDGGKLTEFYHADEDPPEKHDYRLNINDDTPLFILAVWHHVTANGAVRKLEDFYPALRNAAEWILAQREDGMVRCHADGTNVWGICSWRNIIANYNLTGAVTEINAECAAALAVVAAAAQRLEHLEDARRFEEAAWDLRKAVNTRLVSEKTGLYLLNIDNSGEKHHDVTGDEIFPVLLDVADTEVQARVLERLTSDDFVTEWGVRTVAPGQPMYDPDADYQLLGGVWPNLTAWVAFCVRRERPDFLASAMRAMYRLSESERPVDHGFVVPGEFPERLHGTHPASRGMAMSPWMPPTYLWLAVEGLLGFTPEIEGAECNPSIPADWHWIGARRVPTGDTWRDAFFYRGTLYTNIPVRTVHALVVGESLPVEADSAAIFALAFLSDGHLYVCVGSAEGTSGNVTVSVEKRTVRVAVRLERGDALVVKDPSEERAQ